MTQVRLELTAPWSRVKHSATEQLRSLYNDEDYISSPLAKNEYDQEIPQSHTAEKRKEHRAQI